MVASFKLLNKFIKWRVNLLSKVKIIKIQIYNKEKIINNQLKIIINKNKMILKIDLKRNQKKVQVKKD